MAAKSEVDTCTPAEEAAPFYSPSMHDECMEIANSTDAPLVEPSIVVQNALKGKRFCFTGLFAGEATGLPRGKKEMKELTERGGGVYQERVTTTTDYLVAGARPGYNKVEQANDKKRRALVINAYEFEKMLEDPFYSPMPAVFDASTQWSAGYNGNGRGYNPTSPSYSPTCPPGMALADYTPTPPEVIERMGGGKRKVPEPEAAAAEGEGVCA